VVVAPSAIDLDAAAVMAVHARDVLAAHRRVEALADAIAACGLVVAVSGRPAVEHAEPAPPRTLAPAILEAAAGNDVALVFGPEDRGLSNDELARCHRLLTIPSAAAYPSLNLAQAVLICGYELRLASGVAEPRQEETRHLAPAALGERMFSVLEQALRAIGFVHRDNDVHMMRAFRRMLGRAALDEYEARVVLGLARQIDWAARQAAGQLTSKSHPGS